MSSYCPCNCYKDTLSFKELFDTYTEQGLFPIGVSYADIQTVKADLREHYNLLITGTIKSGKSRMLSGIAEQIRLHCPQDSLYVLDSVSGSLQELEAAVNGYARVDNEQEVTALLKEIDELNATRKLKNLPYMDIPEEIVFTKDKKENTASNETANKHDENKR